MKRKAEASSSSLRDIYDTTMRESGVRGAFSFRRMESTMQKRRRLNQPSLPRTVAEAAEVLSTAYMSQQSYALNYLDTVEVAGDHAIIFTDSGRETHGLFDAYEGPLFCDGTFKVTPPLFDSLLTVHLQRGNHVFPLFFALLTSRTQHLHRGNHVFPLFFALLSSRTQHLHRGNHVFPLFFALLTSRTQHLHRGNHVFPLFLALLTSRTQHLHRGNHVFPLFFALLTSRTQQLYVACLSRMKQIMDGITITITMTDYEIGLMNACREVFDCPSHGCWFHYSQALLKRVRKIGLLGAFHRNSDLK
ncbi:hypothetical protein V1264_022547 [Littorina saxatilis]|uniref:MULE transposase domain-containing protein n=1 Tax=Littorina saxatilis TaxID=31220 RepID=A0AAN9AKJ0_9CAEN